MALINSALERKVLINGSEEIVAAAQMPAVMGLAKLAKMSFAGADFSPVWEGLTDTIKRNGTSGAPEPEQCAALMDMCLIDQMRGNAERGMRFQEHALRHCRLYHIPARSGKPKLTLLGFVGPGRINANTPIEFLIENSDIALYLLYVVPGLPLPAAPTHDLAIVLAAESEGSRAVLAETEQMTAAWPRPVLNPPRLVPQMGRERLYQILAHIHGVAIPPTSVVDRADFASLAPSGAFPMIARPVDSHAGDGLQKINGAAEIEAYLGQRPEREFSISPFVDYRSADGLYRKYRIIFIDGKAYPAHMAVSSDWMIHYLNAGMMESAEKRAEEQRFLECFEEDFGAHHHDALTEIAETISLDYFGIDCGETPDGRLLVFEASTALVVHDMDDPEIFPYKLAPIQRIFDAFRGLLEKNKPAPPSKPQDRAFASRQ